MDNIVLDSNFNLKVIDFGAACSITGSDGSGWFMNGEVAGTESYMSPEILLNMPYQPLMADIFALGVIIFVMYTGFYPFESARIDDKHYKYVFEFNMNRFWKKHEKYYGAPLNEDFKDLMSNMLAY